MTVHLLCKIINIFFINYNKIFVGESVSNRNVTLFKHLTFEWNPHRRWFVKGAEPGCLKKHPSTAPLPNGQNAVPQLTWHVSSKYDMLSNQILENKLVP